MPFELGVFLGARQYGSDRQRKKSCLIVGHYEREREIKIGDTALDSPSDREVARRAIPALCAQWKNGCDPQFVQ